MNSEHKKQDEIKRVGEIIAQDKMVACDFPVPKMMTFNYKRKIHGKEIKFVDRNASQVPSGFSPRRFTELTDSSLTMRGHESFLLLSRKKRARFPAGEATRE